MDSSSRPHKPQRPTSLERVEEIIALRRQRLCGWLIAKRAGVSPAAVSRPLRAPGLSRMKDLDPVAPVRRYERDHPGELIPIDIKKLSKFNRVGHRIAGERTFDDCARRPAADARGVEFSAARGATNKGSEAA